MKLNFPVSPKSPEISQDDWMNWTWQLRHSLKTREDFSRLFDLTPEESAGFEGGGKVFQIRSTPYYAALAAGIRPDAALAAGRRSDAALAAGRSAGGASEDPLRKILMPNARELVPGAQAMLDPLGEKRNNPAPRIIHRYPDRLLFLVTDTCSVYCRYCTRKHFTGGDQAFVRSAEYDQALSYIKSKTGLREVILSGGDPLTLSDSILERVLSDLRSIDHVELIRIGTRMPVVCPMRITDSLVQMIRKYNPVYLMTHFNHPRELTREAADGLLRLVDHGIPTFNQLVLLNGVNNHPAIIQALSRRLLYLRVKPYYMFQCDPSEGTDHLRTSIDDSLEIQKELWGRISGLAMPNLSVDIPDGGGKSSLVPNFLVEREGRKRIFEGWDGVRAEYIDPAPETIVKPIDAEDYLSEWDHLKSAKL